MRSDRDLREEVAVTRSGLSGAAPRRYRSIFTASTPSERMRNFEGCLVFIRERAGELLEPERDLARKREQLDSFRAFPVRSRRPLEGSAFYRNHVVFRDDPAAIDPGTLRDSELLPGPALKCWEYAPGTRDGNGGGCRCE
jgi:hypothetical protein